MRFVETLFCLCLCATAASADVKDYCAAYARDVADELLPQKAEWQRRHDNAEKDCLARFAASPPVVEAPSPKRVAKVKPPEKPVAKPKPEAKPKPVVKAPTVAIKPVEKPEEQKAVKAIPKLVAGSAEWLAYCEKKYVSFDAKKGTYLSRNGIERKCLVTAD